MNSLPGILLVAHALVHLAIWLPQPRDGAPFDPGRSWLLGDARRLARHLSVAAATLLAGAGVLLLAGAGLGSGVAIAGASVSLVLVLVTFNAWLLGAVALDVAIVAVAVA